MTEPDQGLFTKDDTPAATETTQEPATTQVESPQGDLFANQLASIRNEDGVPKYDSVEKALEALNHSQEFITQLKAENASHTTELEELRAQVASQASVDEVVERITTMNDTTNQQTVDTGMTEEVVQNLVLKALETRDGKVTKETNFASVTNTLTDKFGDKAKEVIASKAASLGKTVEQLGELASDDPQLVLALFDARPAVHTATPSTGSIRLPTSTPGIAALEAPKKSVLQGATAQEQKEAMLKVKEHIYAKLGVVEN